MVGTTRSARVELRMTPEEKELLAAAAAREHLDVTSFVLRNVLPAAESVLDSENRVIVSQRDAQRILDFLDNPPPPTPALVEAFRHLETKQLDLD